MLGDKIKECRTYKNMQAQELAKMVGASKATFSNWELGNTSPKPEQIRKIADALGVPTDYLLEAGPFEDFDTILRHKDQVIVEIARSIHQTSYEMLYGLDTITFIRLVGAFDVRVREHPGEDAVGMSLRSIVPSITGELHGTPEYRADLAWLQLIHSLTEEQQKQLKGYADALAGSSPEE